MLAALEIPIVGAPLAGGASTPALAAAVSEAGGLGTIAGVRAPIAAELAAARKLTGRPVAVNLLLPFLRPGDAEAAGAADAIVTFWGPPRRLAATTWVHQCGSVEEAKAAAAAGADAVSAQGVEAGGHVVGTTPLFELLERTRAAVSIPVLAAGAIVDSGGVRAVLDAGEAAERGGGLRVAGALGVRAELGRLRDLDAIVLRQVREHVACRSGPEQACEPTHARSARNGRYPASQAKGLPANDGFLRR